MKKLLKNIALAAVAAAMVLSMTACGGTAPSASAAVSSSSTASVSSAESSQAESSSAVDSSEDQENSEDTSAADTSSKFASLEEYVNSPEMQSQLSTLTASMAKQGLDIKVTGEGNKLIYTYTFTKAQKVDAKALSAALEKQSSTFENIASSLKLAANVENPVVVVRYLNADGSELVSREFKAA